jgi:hypothetical protein
VNAGRVSRFHLKLLPFISPQSTLPDPAGAFRASVVGPTSALPHLVGAFRQRGGAHVAQPDPVGVVRANILSYNTIYDDMIIPKPHKHILDCYISIYYRTQRGGAHVGPATPCGSVSPAGWGPRGPA